MALGSADRGHDFAGLTISRVADSLLNQAVTDNGTHPVATAVITVLRTVEHREFAGTGGALAFRAVIWSSAVGGTTGGGLAVAQGIVAVAHRAAQAVVGCEVLRAGQALQTVVGEPLMDIIAR